MKRTKLLLRRTPLAAVSSKRRRELVHYRKLRTTYLGGHPTCECCERRPATDIHHKAGRTSGNYLRVTTWMAVCRECHDYIHRFPKLSKALGYLQPSVRNP